MFFHNFAANTCEFNIPDLEGVIDRGQFELDLSYHNKLTTYNCNDIKMTTGNRRT
jgi:hypothetical protein